MGVTFHWSDHPPKQALASMASFPKRLQAWFGAETEKRAHARKVAKEGLTRGGFFLMGLLLAWLWMMLIGRSVTNRCWLPGALLQLRHRDGSHKVIDVRLSGRYNGSRLVPLNTTLEDARQNRVSKPAYESGYLSKKQRSLQQATTVRDGNKGGVGTPEKEPPERGERAGLLERGLTKPGERLDEHKRSAAPERKPSGLLGDQKGEVEGTFDVEGGVKFGSVARKPFDSETDGQDAVSPLKTRSGEERDKEPRTTVTESFGDGSERVVPNEDGDFSDDVNTAVGLAGDRRDERLSTGVRKVEADRTAEEVVGFNRTAGVSFESSLSRADRYWEAEGRSAGHRTVEQRPDGQWTVEMRLDNGRTMEGPASRRVSEVGGGKRSDGEASEGVLAEGGNSLQARGNIPERLAVERALRASGLESENDLRTKETGNGYAGSTETVVSHPVSGLQLGAERNFQAEDVDNETQKVRKTVDTVSEAVRGTVDPKSPGVRETVDTGSPGVREVVALGKDGNALTLVDRPHPRTRLRNLVFGIAATAATWSERKEILRLWWDPKRLRGYVWMDTPDLSHDNCTKGAVTARDPMAKTTVLWEAHVSGALRAYTNRTCGTGKKVDYSWMDTPDPGLPRVVYSANFSQYAYTHPTGLRSAIRVARVAVEMYRENHENDVLWYVMGDDDTVFCPPNLASVLSKYDPRQLVYIGAPSESHLQNVEFSNEMGYGGGGFALSVTLAKRLSEIFDSCLHRYPEVYGSDARVQACLAELGVHMRKERGFHQYDLLGNMAGALEGHRIAPFLSMHHVAVFQPVFPRKSAMAGLAQLTRTMKRHPREFLQQTMCLNQAQKFSISIAWGYSVRWYPEYIRPTDLERPQRTFRAWNRGREPFDFDMDTRNTPVTICRVPSLFHASGASSRLEDGREMLETRYTRTVTVTDWAEERSLEDGPVRGSSKLRKVSKACPEGEVHIPQREVTEVRVVAPPLSDGWVLAPRRQCCQSVEVVDEKTVQIRLDVCGEGQLLG